MRCAETGTGIAVEVFVKEISMFSVRRVHGSRSTIFIPRCSFEWTLPILIAQPEFDQAIGKLVGNLTKM